MYVFIHIYAGPVGWGHRIHRILLCREVRHPHPMSVLNMTISNLMVRLQ